MNQVIMAMKRSTGLSDVELDEKIIALPMEVKAQVRAMIIANVMPSEEGLEFLKLHGLLSR